MAEASAEYQASIRAAELARTTFPKPRKILVGEEVTAEQDYLSAKNASQEAQIRLDLAKRRCRHSAARQTTERLLVITS